MNNQYEFAAAHSYLNRVREAKRRMEKLQARADNLRSLLTDTAVHISDMPHGESPDRQKDQTIQAEIDEIERRIAELKTETEALRQEIGMTICRIPDPVSQKVLMLFYLENKNWREIAEEIRYSETKIYRLRDLGYEKLGQFIMN